MNQREETADAAIAWGCAGLSSLPQPLWALFFCVSLCHWLSELSLPLFLSGPLLAVSVCLHLRHPPLVSSPPPPSASSWCFLVANPQILFFGGCCSFGGCLIQLMEASVLCDQKAITEIMSRVHQILYYSLPWQTGRLLKGITLSWGSRDEGKPAMWWMGEGGREQPRQREQLRKRL